MILLEGRKEDLYNKYKKEIDTERLLTKSYLDKGSIYDYLIIDPFIIQTNYKYLDTILEEYFKQNAVDANDEEIEPLPKDQARNFIFSGREYVIKLITLIEFYDKNKSKFTYPELRSYSNFNLFIDEAKKLKKTSDEKKIQKNESVKLYEDGDFLLVKPLSHEASCYYGAGTKWCTIMAGNDRYFNDYKDKGGLYYLILKKVGRDNKFYKMAIQASKSSSFDKATWYDSTDEIMSAREKESVLAFLPPDVLKSMESHFGKTELDTDRKLLENLRKLLISYRIENFNDSDFDNKYVKLHSLSIIKPSETNPKVSEFSFTVRVGKNEENTVLCTFTFQTTLLPNKIFVNVKYPANPDSIDEKWFLKQFPNDVLRYTSLEQILHTALKFFDDVDSDNIIPQKYTNAKYTFTRGGKLTKQFMDYIDNLPEGKYGTKKEFLTSINRPTTPGYLSSFFSAIKLAGIVNKVGGAKYEKGPNFERVKKKYFNTP